LVELKNGHLVNCDNFMNITLRDVYRTSADGGVLYTKKHRTFSSLLCMRFLFFGRTCVCAYPQMKCLPVPDMLSDAVKEEQVRAREAGRSSRGAGAGAGARGACVRFSRACPA
ncbi:hypothetical protein EV401DRAFT_1874617, partial [Pisolithus croceorrhizus]